MALNNIQKKLIKYDDASAAEKLVLDKISQAYVEAIPDRDQTNAHNSWSKNFKNVQLSNFRWDRLNTINNFSFIIPIRYGNMTQYGRIFGNDGSATTPISSYCIFGAYTTATSILFLGSTYTGGPTRTDYTVSIPWVSGMFDVLVVSCDMTNKQMKAYSPQTGGILTTAMTLAQSWLTPTTGATSATNFHLNGFNVFYDQAIICGMDTYGTYFIESALTDSEIINIRNHFYNIHKDSAKKPFFQSRITAIGDSLLPQPTCEYKANICTSTTSASMLIDKFYSTQDSTPYTAGKEMATGGVAGAADRRPQLIPGNWGIYTPLTVTDGDCELAGTTNWVLENNTISNMAKVAGSPGGTGTQVLRVNITGSGFARVIRTETSINLPVAVLIKQLTHTIKVSCWVRGQRADAGISYITMLNVNEDQSTSNIPNQKPYKAPSNGQWHFLEREIYNNGNMYIGFSDARVNGDWFEIDDLKVTRVDGAQVDSAICDGYDDYIVSTNALKQVIDNNANYTVAMALDLTDIKAGTRICADYVSADVNARTFDFSYVSGTSFSIYNKPYTSAVLNNPTITLTKAKHIIVYERSISTFKVWIDDVLVLSRSDLDTTVGVITAATIGSYFSLTLSSRIKLGTLLGWNSAIATVNHTQLFNRIKEMYPIV